MTEITATTGPHASSTTEVVVRNPDGLQATLPGSFTYDAAPPPVITHIFPLSGSVYGGSRIVVTGENFVAGETSLVMGGIAASSVVVTNPTTLTALTPAHPAGIVDVSVTADRQSATLASGFAFLGANGISGGGEHTCRLTVVGGVECWGDNRHGRARRRDHDLPAGARSGDRIGRRCDGRRGWRRAHVCLDHGRRRLVLGPNDHGELGLGLFRTRGCGRGP